ncbi:MAG TPA: spore germination protein GerW family protein [Terrimesophilobacter sp.]|jgi:Uncharacterized conserved protein|uniref:spore germination protein GerW family protein n=1 Tax=Terrimesophilobacter sp. TaxID=2906435 RepID=UPI002F950D6F
MNIAEKLADSVKSRGVQLSYGEPIERDGALLVPVAFVGYGFGGGGDDADNGGGGAGGMSVPLGVYVVRNGAVRFHPNPIPMMIASVPLVVAAGFALARILRALR